jgi:4-diphosphocytidyl-2-C-methyl-D-erythritol kinase
MHGYGDEFIIKHHKPITMITTFLFAILCTLPIHGFAPSSWSQHRPTTSIVGLSATPDTTLSENTREGSSSISSNPITLFSPCKINLFLRILRKRPDGYHDLASLFQAIGFGDTLHLSTLSAQDDASTKSDQFTCNMDGVPTDSTNLVIRALELIRQKTGNTNVYFKADLVKRVPAQAGLGGGSANAATAMWGANELLGRPATLDQVRVG